MEASFHHAPSIAKEGNSSAGGLTVAHRQKGKK